MPTLTELLNGIGASTRVATFREELEFIVGGVGDLAVLPVDCGFTEKALLIRGQFRKARGECSRCYASGPLIPDRLLDVRLPGDALEVDVLVCGNLLEVGNRSVKISSFSSLLNRRRTLGEVLGAAALLTESLIPNRLNQLRLSGSLGKRKSFVLPDLAEPHESLLVQVVGFTDKLTLSLCRIDAASLEVIGDLLNLGADTFRSLAL